MTTARQSIGRVANGTFASVARLLPKPRNLDRPITRADFVGEIPTHGRVMEIGPFTNPIVAGSHVVYVDIMDRAELQAQAQSMGLDPAQCPSIDFVAANGDLSGVPGTFDAAVSSHCIEHQPDLVGHLRQVEALLNAGGAYYLIVPDKRYCFDHYIADSTVDEICEAWNERRKVHTPASVLKMRLETTHNSKLRHWLGFHGPRPSLVTHPERLAAAKAECAQAESGIYVDVHAWRFTPESFKTVIAELRSRGLIGLEAARVHATLFGQFEFFAVLRKSGTK